jgi:hypothetical protein
MKVHVTVEVLPHAFLTSLADVGEWSDSRPNRFIPGGTYSLQDTVKENRNLCHCRKSNRDFPAVLPAAYSIH